MADTTPMAFTHSRAFVDRVYYETGQFQWAREAALNALEAGATHLEFGIDWNSVVASGVYRRFIADNGCGMDAAELVTFFRTLGATSKAIGGAHENYGIGAKVSLLPWNTAGLIVASWKHGQGNVIWAKADKDTGEYGLRQVDVDDEIVDVWPTDIDDPELGFAIEELRPAWIEDNGTVLLLLGDSLDQDTLLNDPRHDKPGNRALHEYLSRRFWQIPDSVEIQTDETRVEKAKWPRDLTSVDEAKWPLHARRQVFGAQRTLPRDIAHKGVLSLPDGTRLHWAFGSEGAATKEDRREAFRDSQGFIAALYRNELYEHKSAASDYRNFGIGHAAIRRQLWLIVEPPEADDDRRNGAFPESDRNALMWGRDTGESEPLPWPEWGDVWTAQMPSEVREAIDAQAGGGELTDQSYIDRLANLLGDRFQMRRRVVHEDGDVTVEPTDPQRRRRRKRSHPASTPERDRNGEPRIGPEGTVAAREIKPKVALPRWEPADQEDIGVDGMIAAFVPTPSPGVVQIDVGHPMIVGQVEYWVKHYPHDPQTVKEIVHGVYGESAVAVVGHSEELKRLKVQRRTIDEEIRSPYALTTALLGLMPHDELIKRRLRDKIGRRRSQEDAA